MNYNISYFAASTEKMYGSTHKSVVCLQVIFCISVLYHIHWALWWWYNFSNVSWFQNTIRSSILHFSDNKIITTHTAVSL